MILVGARFRRRVHDAPDAAELSAIGVGESLKLIDRVDPQRGAKRTRSAAAIPVTAGVGVVEKKQHSDGSRSGNRVVLLRPEQRAGASGIEGGDARRESHQLEK